MSNTTKIGESFQEQLQSAQPDYPSTAFTRFFLFDFR